MELSPFRIERYYARYEFTTRYMLSSSDCESRAIGELLELEPDAHDRLLQTWCGYTESPGSLELRRTIATLYAHIDPDDVIVTSCAEEGIFLLYYNPTGTLMDRATFERALAMARERDVTVFSDEVYRELEHDARDRLPAACDLDRRAISLGSISKSYGLPGLRLGWLATRDAAVRDALLRLKDYTTICSSAPSEVLTAVALRNREVLLERNHAIVQRNLPLLDGFFMRHAENFQWVRPTAGPIGFPRLSGLGDVDRFCDRLAATGVLLLPGSVYDCPAHVRIGYGRADMPAALQLLDESLAAPAPPAG